MDNIEETAKKKKPMPPGAAQQLAGVPKPNNALVPVEGTRTVNPDPLGRAPRLVGGAANPVPAAAPAGPLPNYRTGAPAGQPQFQQTPTPVNPQVRSAAAQLGSVPESSAASTLAKPSVVGRAGNALKAIPGGRVVTPVAALLEGSQVVEKIRDPKASALDVAVQGARGVARTALGGAGAIAGTPGGLGGQAAGGLAGYELADRVIDAGTGERYGPMAKAFQDTFDNNLAAQAAMRLAMPLANIPGVPGMIGAVFDPKEQPAQTAVPKGDSTVMAGAALGTAGSQVAADTSKVIGTFNGRPITQAQADELAGKVSSIPAAPQAAQKLGAQISYDTNYNERRGIISQIDAALKVLGPNPKMRSKRELLQGLLGLKSSLYQNDANAEQQRGTEQAKLDAGSAADQLGATTQLDIARMGLAGRQQTPIVGDDGNLYTLSGNTLTPVTDASGKPAKAPADNKESRALYGDLLKNMLGPGATAENLASAQALLSQIPALTGIAGESADGVPAGYTATGKVTKDGTPIYQDAKGNKVTF